MDCFEPLALAAAKSTRRAKALRFLEIARVLVRVDHISRFIVNANHSAMSPAVKLCVADLHC
jgi:hypothetical protein